MPRVDRQGCWLGISLLTVVFAFVGCSESSSSGGDGDTGSVSASLACDHFRNVAGDASDGLLTDAELREKLKEVYDNSIGAAPEITAAARDMLAAITSGTNQEFTRSIRAMGKACADNGS